MDQHVDRSLRWIFISLVLYAGCGAAMYAFLILVREAAGWDLRIVLAQGATIGAYLAALLCGLRAVALIWAKAERSPADMIYLATSLLLALTLGLCVLVICLDARALMARRRHLDSGRMSLEADPRLVAGSRCASGRGVSARSDPQAGGLVATPRAGLLSGDSHRVAAVRTG